MEDAFLSEFNQADEYLRRRFSLSGIDLDRLEDVKWLNEMSQEIRARLSDAEEMEITSKSARLCLRKLKKSFYDAEEVLDEFLYHVMHLKSEGATFPADANVVRADSSMVDREYDPSSYTNSNASLSFMDALVKKISPLKDRLENEKMDWDLHVKGLPKIDPQRPTNHESTSFMGPTPPVGRDVDLVKIGDLLKSELNGHDNIPVIAIVGMGGLGKTTLAQMVYNDPQSEKLFDLKIWVSVPENFDLLMLTKAMLENLELNKCDLTQLDSVQKKVNQIVKGKRLLLVLDDVWEHENLKTEAWEQLYNPLSGVSKESRILVTTRSKKVSYEVIMGASVYPLPYLTDDDCFTLFSHHASKGRTSDINSNLLDIGKEISNRCRGLPLAAKTLGSLLSRQDDVEVWNGILNNSGIWDSDEQNQIMPILRLSYQYLCGKLKKCFRYCSVFPKGYQFHKDQLISMWMAHGYITRTKRGRKQLEDIGEEYINELISRSLFEQSRNDSSEEVFSMHDLIHDLVRDVSQGEWRSVEDGVCNNNRDDNVQHFSVISTVTYPPEFFQMQPQSRCLLFFNSELKWPDMKTLCSIMKQLRVLDMSYTGIRILPESVGDLKHLRYLGVQGNQIKEVPKTLGTLYLLETLNLNYTSIEILPDSIFFLKCLRYLGLRGTLIKYLPESLGMLDQLHTLDVEFCKIDHLPDCMKSLSGLRRLICEDHVVFPSEIRKLTNLQRITRFFNGRHAVVKELTDMVHVNEAKKASLYSKEHLKVLSLVWNDRQSPAAGHIHGEVLECLGPHPKLRQLYMDGFGGHSLPSWLADPSYLCSLNRIDLIRCEQLMSLPPLEKYPSLRHVYIESAKKLQNMGLGDPFSVTNFNSLRVIKIIRCPQLQLLHLGKLASLKCLSVKEYLRDIPTEFTFGGFLQLERLELEDLPNWRSWTGPRQGECPKLQNLSIVDCKNLPYFSISYCDTLEDIYVKHCPQLQALGKNYASKRDTLGNELLPNMEPGDGGTISEIDSLQQTLAIIDCPNMSSFSAVNFNDLHVLKIIRCHQLQLSHLGDLTSLQHLSIIDSHQDIPDKFSYRGFLQLESLELKNLPNWRSWAGPQEGECPNLQKLSIVGCNSLEKFSISCLHNLKDIYVKNCPRLGISGPHIVKLLSLEKCYVSISMIISHGYHDLYAMKDIKITPYSPFTDLWNFSTFEQLVISRCNNLEYLSSECLPSSIKAIVIHNCQSLEKVQLGNQDDLQYLSIKNCQSLKKVQLGNQDALQYLSIKNCPRVSQIVCRSSTLRFLEIHSSDESVFYQQRFHKAVFHHLGNLRNVEYLSIMNCVFKFSDVLQLPSALKVMKIDCSIFKLLEIAKCSDLTFFLRHWLEDLEELQINDTWSWPTSVVHAKWLPLKLKKLEIVDCFDLTSFSLHLLENLDELIIKYHELDVFPDMKWLVKYSVTFFPLHMLESFGELRTILSRGPTTFTNAKWLPSTLKKLEIDWLHGRSFSTSRKSNALNMRIYLPLDQLYALESLKLKYDPQLYFPDEKSLPSTLQELCIIGWPTLNELKISDGAWPTIFTNAKGFPSRLKKLEIIKCSNLTSFPLHVIENLEELRIIDCSGPAAFTDAKWLPSTLKKLEISKFQDYSFSTSSKSDALNMEIYLPLDRLYALEFLELKYNQWLCFPDEKSLPSTLQELCIIKCPALEVWCKRNSQRLMDIQLRRRHNYDEDIDDNEEDWR